MYVYNTIEKDIHNRYRQIEKYIYRQIDAKKREREAKRKKRKKDGQGNIDR